MTDSITDVDIALEHADYLRLIRRLPPETVIDFWTRTSAYESRHHLADRLRRYRDAVRPAFESTPPLQPNASSLAEEWAQTHFNRGLRTVSSILYAEDDRLSVVVEGDEILSKCTRAARMPIIVSLHQGPYQALPAYLARMGFDVASFMDAQALALLRRLYDTLIPRLGGRVESIGLPSEDATRRALGAIRSGRLLLTLPEFSLGSDGSAVHTVDFLGRKVRAPLGTARLARAFRVPIVPITIDQTGLQCIRLRVEEPIFEPGSTSTVEAVTERIFEWIEARVADDPAGWWCWEIFERRIAADTASAPPERRVT